MMSFVRRATGLAMLSWVAPLTAVAGFALGLGVALAPQTARAQSCEAVYQRCIASCGCKDGDLACLIRCPNYAVCLQTLSQCRQARGEAGGGTVPRSRASGSEEAPAAAAPPPAPSASRSARRTQSTSLQGRVFFLVRSAPEPRTAKYYGYLVIGPNVSAERKIAVMRGIGCRLDVAPTLEAAEKIKNLGLVSLPSVRPASGDTTNPLEMINNYDAVRAERWMEAAADAADTRFNASRAILFIGSTKKLADLMDRRRMPEPLKNGITIADASDLNPRYLERWTHEVVKGVKSGDVASRQDMQSLMEYHSWLTMLGSPLAAVLRVGATDAQAATPPASCL